MEYRANTPLLEAFEELNKLHEATDLKASSEFWDFARSGKIATGWFHKAYDEELKILGLMDLFNTDGLLANKGSWGRIKTAKEANPDSWAVKALQKMWVLQYKEGVTQSLEQQIAASEKEYEVRRKAELTAKQEQERIKKEAKFAELKKEYVILSDKLTFVENIVKKLADDYAAEKKAQVIPQIEKIIKQKAEINTATKGIINKSDKHEKINLDKLTKSGDLIEVSVELPEPTEYFEHVYIRVNVTQFFGEHVEQYAFRRSGMHARYFTDLTIRDLDEAAIKSEVTSLFDDIWHVIGYPFTVSTIPKLYGNLMPKINAAKAAQAAANTNKPVDPSFISGIIDDITRGINKAEDAYEFYSSSHDGSSGAAYALSKHETIVSLCAYLINCNWRAFAKGKEVASWRMTDSEDDLYQALQNTFKAAGKDLSIEIIK
jgi:hypothetical protein